MNTVMIYDRNKTLGKIYKKIFYKDQTITEQTIIIKII